MSLLQLERCCSPVHRLEQAAQTLDFVEYHRPALERDEVRHNVILANLGRLVLDHPPKVRRWTLGAPGECAVQSPGYPIVLGELTQAQCRALAYETRDLDYPGVVGSFIDSRISGRTTSAYGT
jgi:hypothetical protein